MNLKPKIGLFSGARGRIIDIIFYSGQNPNNGDSPAVVVVDFFQYKGPPWDPETPTHIPIKPISRMCEHRCCERTQVPLTIAWAKTIHTFQGQTVGFPKENGQQYTSKRIIVDLGTRSMEALCPGLTYVALSRATTIGGVGEKQNIPTKSLDSAFYFKSGTFPKNIQNLTNIVNSTDEYLKVKSRNNWVNYLRTKETNIQYTKEEECNIVTWFMEQHIPYSTIINYTNKHPLPTGHNFNQNIENITIGIKLNAEISMPTNIMNDYFKLFMKKYKKYIVMDTHISKNLAQFGKQYWKQQVDSEHYNQIQTINKALITNSVSTSTKNKKIIVIPWCDISTNSKIQDTHKSWSLIILQRVQNKYKLHYHNSLHRQPDNIKELLQQLKIYTPLVDEWIISDIPKQLYSESGPRICYALATFAQVGLLYQSKTKDNITHLSLCHVENSINYNDIMTV